MSTLRTLICSTLCLFALDAGAEGWCDLAAGSYDLATNGTVSDQVFLVGQLSGAPSATLRELSQLSAHRQHSSRPHPAVAPKFFTLARDISLAATR